MAERSAIEWTEATWSPVRARWLESDSGAGKLRVGWHCEHVSEGCRNCYAEGINRRLGTGFDFKPGHRRNVEVFLDEKMLLAPLKWQRPRRIFVCSMTDLFADFVPDAMIDRVFAVMALCPRHTFQVLTKRPRRMRAYFAEPALLVRIMRVVRDMMTVASDGPLFADGHPLWPLPNVWLGTSTEDQATADARVPELLATPAALRFVSAEPLLGPLYLAPWLPRFGDCDCPVDDSGPCDHYDCQHEPCPKAKLFAVDGEYDEARPETCWTKSVSLDWIITGGESGRSARPMHPAWVCSIRDQCAAAGVAFFHKQHGEFRPVGPIIGDDSPPIFDVDERRSAIICGDGSIWPEQDGQPPSCAWMIERVGKKAAGRLLDGVEWSQMPEARA